MKPVRLAILWHLHQPLYRLQGERACFHPWARLHAIRSYYDMVRILEEFPDLRLTLNLTPVLVEQIRAYAEGGSDLFWEAAAVPAEDLDDGQRAFLFDHFFSAQPEQMIGALPRYADLYERRQGARRLRGPGEAWKEFALADYRDLQIFFDLCWFGFKAREDFPELGALQERGMSYTREDAGRVHEIERDILRRLLPLYRAAAAGGRIEISTSPYAHPILPLLVDTDSAREAMPHAALPPRARWPHDARAQIDDALALMERELGVRPRGLWPSEGALSHEAAALVAGCGLTWSASDEQVLAASELEGAPEPRRAWQVEGAPASFRLAFRDHDLSDRIGFSYARVSPAQAVEGLLSAVRERGARAPGGGLVLLALDGENPWEHYPRAGAGFLRALYAALSRSPDIACDTLGDAIAALPEAGKIRRLRAASWIHADLSTWIGEPEKNRAWSVLGQVRESLDIPLRDPALPDERRQKAWAALRAAQGSDWFWWLDGRHATPYLSQLDQTFRAHLRQACEALGRAAPEALGWPIPSPERRAAGERAAEPEAWIEPRIDGYEGDLFEWRAAVRLTRADLSAPAAMQRARRGVESLRYGFSRQGDFFLRLDAGPDAGPGAFGGAVLELSFRCGEHTRHLRVELDEPGDLRQARLGSSETAVGESGVEARPCAVRAAARKILELAVPASALELPAVRTAGLLVRLRGRAGETALREIGLRLPAAWAHGAGASA